MNLDSFSQPVIAHLLQRGLEVERYNPPDEICWPEAEQDTFYHLLGESSLHRIEREIFSRDSRLYILNSNRNITSNLRTCLKFCFQQPPSE